MKKIPTIFQRNPENMKELLDEPHPQCGWVFKGEGVATRKYDGTCVKIEGNTYFKRREVKKGKNAPSGFILEDKDLLTGKCVGWVEVDKSSKEDRWHMQGSNGLSTDRDHDGTFELVGPKIQGNPENFPIHILIKHASSEKYQNVPRTFEELKEWLKDKDIEGLVFHHPDGRMAKIKKRDFNLNRINK